MGDYTFMDSQQQCSRLDTHLPAKLPPAQLWIGSYDKLVMQTHNFLQQRWCKAKGCNRCSACRLIVQHQHHGALWISPKDKYTRDDLEPVFHALQFALDEGCELFFVIQKADYLTPACYNSLLKSIEEPPRGYHFILLSERLKEVASTIISRCVVENFSSEIADIRKHPLALPFTSHGYEQPFDFMHVLEQTDPSEHETQELIDSLLAYWILSYKQSLQENDKAEIDRAARAIQLLEQALQEPPMSGSSKLFWKNLFVRFKE